MKISSGITDYQILQRNTKGYASVRIVGTCDSDGGLEYKIWQSRKSRSPWLSAGNSRKGHFKIQISQIPTGGPYTIDIRSPDQHNETVGVHHIHVGDLWIMAGQSNMQGVGCMDQALTANPQVHMFSMRDQWKKAEDPVNFCFESLDQAHRGSDPFRENEDLLGQRHNLLKGVGPGIAFANYLQKKYAVPIGLVPCAKGGSSMSEWSPRLKNKNGKSLFGALLRRVEAVGGKVAGMIWSQGCSDAAPEQHKQYSKRMETLLRSLRTDLAWPLPSMLVQINGFYDGGRWDLSGACWTSIRSQQAALAHRIRKFKVVSSVDLDLDDGIHLSAAAQHRVGVRLAKAASYLYDKNSNAGTSPQIQSISAKQGNHIAQTAFGSFAVKISNYHKHIISDGSKVLGFSLRDRDGNKCMSIYKAWIHDNMIILQTELNNKDLKKYTLYYGYGLSPLCNITDGNDQALLASGPHLLPPT